MDRDRLSILVVEDDFFVAEDIACSIRERGDHVIGPFPDIAAAIRHVGQAGAAILDIRVGNDTSFDLADALTRHGKPFLFYTGLGRWAVPPRLTHARLVAKPCDPGALVEMLHRMDGASAERPIEIEDVLPALRLRARQLLPDPFAADRLVEATLRRAISSTERLPASIDANRWLLALLELEHALDSGRHLT